MKLLLQEVHIIRELIIEYNIENCSNDVLYIFDPDPPYILTHENDQIVIAFSWLPVPENIDVEVIEQPGVFELAPSMEKKGLVRVNVPVKQSPPYEFFDINKAPIERNAKQLKIIVGFVKKRKDLNFVDTYCRGKLVRSLNVTHSQQELILSQPKSIDIPIEARFPNYKPFMPTLQSYPIKVSFNVIEVLTAQVQLKNTLSSGVYICEPPHPLFTITDDLSLNILYYITPRALQQMETAQTGMSAFFLGPGEKNQHKIEIKLPISLDPQKSPIGKPVLSSGVCFSIGYWEEEAVKGFVRKEKEYPMRVWILSEGFKMQKIEQICDLSVKIPFWK